MYPKPFSPSAMNCGCFFSPVPQEPFSGCITMFFRALRLTIPHHGFFVFLEDVIFLATYAIFLSAFASAEARGELRAYYAFGGILGFTLYHFTIGRFIMRFIKKIIGSVKIIFAIIVKPAKIIAAKFVGITKNAVKSNKNAPQPLQYDAEI